jgi:outer membrane protein assembly factor BamB
MFLVQLNNIVRRLSVVVLILCFGLIAGPVHGENWPQWRGPYFNGSSGETNLPVSWSKTNGLSWSLPLPGKSGATPIIWNDTIFATSPDAQNNLLLFCVDRKSGQVRWQKPLDTGNRNTGKNNMASPSPVTDGKWVYVLFGTGMLTACDFDGNIAWQRSLAQDYGRFAFMWLYGSSPLLYQNRLYVQIIQRSKPYSHSMDDKPTRDSMILCLDPNTGKNLWSHVRVTDATGESQESYATPYPYVSDQGAELIIAGGNFLTGHDLASGAEIWRFGGFNQHHLNDGRVNPTPVSSPGLIYACGPKREILMAVKDHGKGTITETHKAWQFTDAAPDVCTPLYYKGKLFVLCGDRQILTCLEPQSGKVIWQDKLGVREVFSASPTGADDKIYCLSENGTTVVLSAGDTFKILSTNVLDESPTMGSIAPASGHLYIRTGKALHSIRP